jgi:endonuclease/exonuclease/phosphatase family metal-dependent hydrolase
MKKLSWFNKLVFALNVVLAALTYCAYILPFLAPKLFPFLSSLTLILPLFLILNGVCFIYWLLQLKRQLFLSGIALLIGITFINKFYKFTPTQKPKTESDIVVMSYNVRLFNIFEWIPDPGVSDSIKNFVSKINPDVLCIQEYSANTGVDFRVYKHRFILSGGNQIKSGQAIFSKFPIINTGNINLKSADNTMIFADLKVGKDTIRVYDIHLQSVQITHDVNKIQDDVSEINASKSKSVLKRISSAFKEQQRQAEVLKKHKESCKYPVIICADMNNSAFSYVYRTIKGDLKDGFEEAGKGFGATYDFKYYPARIDYIFVNPKMEIKEFESFPKFKNSDHFPIVTRVALKN